MRWLDLGVSEPLTTDYSINASRKLAEAMGLWPEGCPGILTNEYKPFDFKVEAAWPKRSGMLMIIGKSSLKESVLRSGQYNRGMYEIIFNFITTFTTKILFKLGV